MSQIISIEGNIGSGKSTILNYLKEHFKTNEKIIFLQEPVSEWDKIRDKNNVTILSKFYENQKKYSFAFQMMAYISRLSLLKDTIEKNPDSIIITERCLNTDRHVFAKMLYDAGNLEDIEYQIYLQWFDHFSNIIKIQKIIYLKTNPITCNNRINKRNRDGESNISIDYLENCHKYHESMINNFKDTSIVINSDIDTDIYSSIINTWINTIEDFIFN
jgi:deoxyadenosine/deoxycytidine kinase